MTSEVGRVNQDSESSDLDEEDTKPGFSQSTSQSLSSDVPARLGLKAMALAWLSTAQAFTILRPGQSRQSWLALAWPWPEPRPEYGKCKILYISESLMCEYSRY